MKMNFQLEGYSDNLRVTKEHQLKDTLCKLYIESIELNLKSDIVDTLKDCIIKLNYLENRSVKQ